MSYQYREQESQNTLSQNSNNLQDTDLEDRIHCLPENEFCCKKMVNHTFVIGISKPGEQRIGLQTIQKNKITIKGRLGIDEKQ
ncbi:unnamed protein product [Paramecium pentaurelia]|uniref:Uncharacterized protein n=1 Tax=Paramecium pentaurelia TaxID=43138 RepID=A0A8S1X3B2_9CILI|nr:unnamed protein product [Paramecium pentaurelia]